MAAAVAAAAAAGTEEAVAELVDAVEVERTAGMVALQAEAVPRFPGRR